MNAKEIVTVFKSMYGGFHIQFENGICVSVQFRWANYCENRDNKDYAGFPIVKTRDDSLVKSKDAEIAIWDKDNNWITDEFFEDGDQVQGYVTPEKLLEVLNWAKDYKRP